MVDITIETVNNGYIVTAGCMAMVFQERKNMLSEIERYLTKPKEVEREYSKIEKNYLVDKRDEITFTAAESTLGIALSFGENTES